MLLHTSMSKKQYDKLGKCRITVVLLTIATLLIHLGRKLGWFTEITVIPEFLCIVATLVFVAKYYLTKYKVYEKYIKDKEKTP